MQVVDASYYIVYRECVNNKVLSYCTKDYIQYPIINHHGKGNEKEYVCITEPLCWIPETNTTLQINYTSLKHNISKIKLQKHSKNIFATLEYRRTLKDIKYKAIKEAIDKFDINI